MGISVAIEGKNQPPAVASRNPSIHQSPQGKHSTKLLVLGTKRILEKVETIIGLAKSTRNTLMEAL